MIALSSAIFPSANYTSEEKTELEQWLIKSSDLPATPPDARLADLNTHLSSRTTILGSKPSVADIAVFARVSSHVSSWTPEQRTGAVGTGHHHIVRHVDFVQSSPLFRLKLDDADRVAIDQDDVVARIPPVDAKAQKEKKKKEKEAQVQAANKAVEGDAAAATGARPSLVQKTVDAVQSAGEAVVNAVKSGAGPEAAAKDVAAAAATGKKEKKEKKEKQPKPAKPAAPEKPLSPALIDLRVGHILKAERHPNADSLYVSTVAVGDAPGTDNTHEFEGQVCRTVCSGLNGLVPLEDMQRRLIVAVCNLKPVTMRGIKSAAMVLAASPRDAEAHAGPVELVELPAGAKAGDRVYFDGWQGEPEAVLNPKKKVWEMLQPGFTTTQGLEVLFDVAAVEQLAGSEAAAATASTPARLMTKDGPCTVKSLKDATVR